MARIIFISTAVCIKMIDIFLLKASEEAAIAVREG